MQKKTSSQVEDELVMSLNLAATVSPTSAAGRNHQSISPVNNRYKHSLEEKNTTNSEASKKSIEDVETDRKKVAPIETGNGQQTPSGSASVKFYDQTATTIKVPGGNQSPKPG